MNKAKIGKSKLNFNSLKVKLMIILIVICQVPLISFGAITYKMTGNILYSKLKATTNQEVDLVNVAVDNYFNGLIASTEMLSNNIDFKEIIIHPDLEFNAKSLIKGIKDTNGDIELIQFSTTDKKTIKYPEEQTEAGYDPTSRPWYKGAVENKEKIYITEPYKSNGKLVVGIAKSVTYNNEIIGVISISVNLDKLAEKISEFKVGNEGYIYISDVNGVIISHPDKSIIGEGAAAKQTYWNEVKENSKGFTEYIYNGESKYASYSTNNTTGWKILASMPENELKVDTNKIVKLLIIFFIVALPINLIVASVFSKGINDSIKKLKEIFGKASAGDLTERLHIKSKDEFGDLANSFNSMTDGICDLISSVKKSSETIADTAVSISTMSDQTTSAVEDIAKTIDQVSVGSTEQARDVEASVEELQELVYKLQEINEQAKSMHNVSENTDKMTKDGLFAMDILSSKSVDTNNASDKIEIAVKDMSGASSNIRTIINSINAIAEQTNLLALNAAIEAARAGEAGRGFSIVADEIRKLAEESTLATKDIEKLIEEVDDKSQVAVKAVNEAKSTIQEQGEAVNKTKATFDSIAKAIDNLTNMINTVQNSIIGIDKEKDVIMEKMQNLSAISEETAASTEEVSAATEEVSATMEDFNGNAKNLKDLAENLSEDINKFRI
ncbi:methyl-accepting chemotaxis protein [Clostridium sp. HBUAS56017]|uniref:methyl-accepting chemotaxis protein n=1 Tax=Clostridium sp. HBUAS56017 TaxID=2571128 RepID=UPI0011786AFA|nr:methyl-accepting chemotaxis protein [Clostridium sp. HBUAS56017]